MGKNNDAKCKTQWDFWARKRTAGQTIETQRKREESIQKYFYIYIYIERERERERERGRSFSK